MKLQACIFSILFGSLVSAATLDAWVAKVNDVVITLDDVRNEIRRNPEISDRLARMDTADADQGRKIYKAALDALVERRLVLAQAAEKKMEIQEWIVDNRIREIVKDRFAGDMSRFEANLAASRIPLTEFRETLKEDMIVSAMRYQMVEKDIQPSPAEMKKEYASFPERYRQAARASVRVILLKGQDGKVKEVLAQLDKGVSFADAAIRYSADSHAQQGGLWKDVEPEKAFRKEIVEVLDALEVGARSQPVTLDGWTFILFKEAASPARALTFAEAYVQVAKNVRAETSRRLYREWIARLRAAAYIKEYPMPDSPK